VAGEVKKTTILLSIKYLSILFIEYQTALSQVNCNSHCFQCLVMLHSPWQIIYWSVCLKTVSRTIESSFQLYLMVLVRYRTWLPPSKRFKKWEQKLETYRLIGCNRPIIVRFADYRYRPISWWQQSVLADYWSIPIIINFIFRLDYWVIKSNKSTALRDSTKSYYCVTHYSTTVSTWKQV